MCARGFQDWNPGDEMSCIEFKLKDETDEVVHNGAVRTVGSLVKEKQESEPTAQVAYHSLQLNAETPGAFTLTQLHRVFLMQKDQEMTKAEEATTLAQANIGGRVP